MEKDLTGGLILWAVIMLVIGWAYWRRHRRVKGALWFIAGGFSLMIAGGQFERLGLAFGVMSWAGIAWLVYYGFRLLRGRNGKHVRGSRVTTSSGWRFPLIGTRRHGTGHQLKIGGADLPRNLEQLHVLVAGSTGTGKSQTINGLLDAIRARGDRVIVTDIGGEALARWWREGDIILNPLDTRSPAWSPFAELDGPWDADRVAKSMIPDADGHEREWFVYSQALVAAVMRRLWEANHATNEAFMSYLTNAKGSELEKLVRGLPAQALFHEGAEKMLSSVRGIIGSYLSPYSYLPADAGHGSWSIRRWIQEGRGWLWIPYREDQAAMLKPLLATWMGEIVAAVLSLRPDSQRRIWLLLDEVASLGRIQNITDALTKGRKYGLCGVLGLQSVSQLRATYGHDGAQTLLSCLSSQLILRANDPETAEYFSRHLGEQEIVQEDVSHGERSTTVSERRHVQRAVLPSEIQQLPDRVGYLRLSGPYPARIVTVPLIERPQVISAYVPRSLNTESPPASKVAVPVPDAASPPLLDADAILGPSVK